MRKIMAKAVSVDQHKMASKELLVRSGPVTRAKAKAVEMAYQVAPSSAVLKAKSLLTPKNHSTTPRAPGRPRVGNKRFADRLTAEQALVEAEMKCLEKALERTKVQ